MLLLSIDCMSCTSSLAFPLEAAGSTFATVIMLCLELVAVYLLLDHVCMLVTMESTLSSGTFDDFEVREMSLLSPCVYFAL